jgi:hypothetical protein
MHAIYLPGKKHNLFLDEQAMDWELNYQKGSLIPAIESACFAVLDEMKFKRGYCGHQPFWSWRQDLNTYIDYFKL